MSSPITLFADASLNGAEGPAAWGDGVTLEAYSTGVGSILKTSNGYGVGVNSFGGFGDVANALDLGDGAEESFRIALDAPADDVGFTLTKFAEGERAIARAYDAEGVLLEELSLSSADGTAGSGYTDAVAFTFAASGVASIVISAAEGVDGAETAFGLASFTYTPGEDPDPDPEPGETVELVGDASMSKVSGPIVWDDVVTVEAVSTAGDGAQMRYTDGYGLGVNSLNGVNDVARMLDSKNGAAEALVMTFAEPTSFVGFTLLRFVGQEIVRATIETAEGSVVVRDLVGAVDGAYVDDSQFGHDGYAFDLPEEDVVSLTIEPVDGAKVGKFGLAALRYGGDGSTPPPPPTDATGAIEIEVLDGEDVFVSTYGSQSFEVWNTGDKDIVSIHFDITDALVPDTVFDPFGLAGDEVSRSVYFGNNAKWAVGTGAIVPDLDDPSIFDGPGGELGYEGVTISFDPNDDDGFNPGESFKFGVDLDPNSIVGYVKGEGPSGDIAGSFNDPGGVSGLEISNTVITITFDDGSTVSGELLGDGSDGGSNARIAQADEVREAELTVALSVEGVGEGTQGLYDENIQVEIQGEAGATARVVMLIGIVQPYSYAVNLAPDAWQANNALQVQTVEVALTGGVQDISGLFDFDPVLDDPGGDAEYAPLGFVAGVIEEDWAVGPVSDPIHLEADPNVFDFS